MKKFVGTVNGKTFDNEKDFQAAANEAIKSNDENLSISSYYSYVNELPEETKKLESTKDECDAQEAIILHPENYLLGAPVPGGKYKASEELKNDLRYAGNKEEIRKELNSRIVSLANSMSHQEQKIQSLMSEITRLQGKLQMKKDKLKDITARRDYYHSLLPYVTPVEKSNKSKINEVIDSLKGTKIVNKEEFKNKVHSASKDVNKKIKEILDFLEEMGFDF